ncbi:MAG: OmpA family protein [Cytophagaceae bacterium]|nr:OmpA family protein [Cytophagaceae bacterium]MDW8457026.1 OmpA family protein [Cytophagaceae bacterium]
MFKKIHLTLFIVFFTLTQTYAQLIKINALALRNGSKLLSKPASVAPSNSNAFISDWMAEALIDENGRRGWSSAPFTALPMVFVFELSEMYNISELGFNNNCPKNTPGVCVKEVKVEFSTTSSFSGYSTVGTFKLEEWKEKNYFKINSAPARWVRITLLSNYGNQQYTQLMEMEAWGVFNNYDLNSLPIEGVWDSNWDWVSLKKNEHGYYYGCYKFNNGILFSGKVTRRVFEFEWDETAAGARKGWATLVINEEGSKLRGIWGYDKDHSVFGIWEFTFKTNQPNKCPNDEAAKNKKPENYDLPIVNKKNVTENTYSLKVTCLDAATSNPLAAKIEIKNTQNNSDKITGGCNAAGNFQVTLNKTKSYSIAASLSGYIPYSSALDAADIAAGEKKILLNKIELGKSVVLKNVLFVKSTTQLIDSSYAELDNVIKLLQENPGMEIEIAGHTDNVGNPADNLKLSQERANTVRNYIIQKGNIKASRLISRGYGGEKPLYDNSKEETRKMNRRVEFKILKL